MTAVELAPRAATPRQRERSLGSYLLLPRPGDLSKACVAPLVFLLGVVAAGGVPLAQVGRAVVVWLALELLVYQARYQWNDARGFSADQAHPDRAARGRLPGPLDRARPHLTATLVVAALRLALTALVAVVVPGTAGVVAGMTAGVFGAALLYEGLRSAATGRTGQVPVPLSRPLVGLWAVTGAGYAVRGTTGLVMAVDLGGRPGALAAAVLATWATGVVFVTCRWALEALCFGELVDGRLRLSVTAEQAREHTVGLVRWLPRQAPPGTRSPCAWRALSGPTPLTAPWHAALAVASASALVAGALLVEPVDLVGVLLLAACGVLSAAVVALGAEPRTAVGLLWLAVLGVLTTVTVQDAVVASLPWLSVHLLHLSFTAQCADDIGGPLRRVRPPSRG